MMSKLFFSCGILVLLIGVGGFIYTLKVVKQTTVRQSEYDSEVSEKVNRHYVLLNPVFLSYLIGFGLLLLFIGYLALTSSW